MPRAPKKCGDPNCETRVQGRPYCPPCTAKRQTRANTTQRGYGWQHQQNREAWRPQVATGTVACWRCRELLSPTDGWHLGHDDNDRTITRGPEHDRACNLRAAGKAAHRGGTPHPTH